MSFENVLTPDDTETIVGEYNAMLTEAEQSTASLEDVIAGLDEIADTVRSENTICQTQAVALEGICAGILPRFAPIQSFTQRPSVTNLKIALEEIDKKKAGIIAAIVLAVGAFIYKLWKWITGKSADATDGAKQVTDGLAKVEKAEENYKAATQEAEKAGANVKDIEKEIMKDETSQQNVAVISDKFTPLVHLAFTTNFLSVLNLNIGKVSGAREDIRHLIGIANASMQKWNQQYAHAVAAGQAEDPVKMDQHIRRMKLIDNVESEFQAGGAGLVLGKVTKLHEALAHFRIIKNDMQHHNPDVETQGAGVQFEMTQLMKAEVEWFRKLLTSLSEFGSGTKEVHGVVQIEQLLTQASSFKARAAALHGAADSLKQLEGIEDEFDEESVQKLVQTINKQTAEDPNAWLDFVRSVQQFIAAYSQVIAIQAQVFLKTNNQLRSFVEACEKHQKHRAKSFVQKAKESVGLKGKDAALDAIRNFLIDNSH